MNIERDKACMMFFLANLDCEGMPLYLRLMSVIPPSPLARRVMVHYLGEMVPEPRSDEEIMDSIPLTDDECVKLSALLDRVMWVSGRSVVDIVVGIEHPSRDLYLRKVLTPSGYVMVNGGVENN